jgi:hypothetical protein
MIRFKIILGSIFTLTFALSPFHAQDSYAGFHDYSGKGTQAGQQRTWKGAVKNFLQPGSAPKNVAESASRQLKQEKMDEAKRADFINQRREARQGLRAQVPQVRARIAETQRAKDEGLKAFQQRALELKAGGATKEQIAKDPTVQRQFRALRQARAANTNAQNQGRLIVNAVKRSLAPKTQK